MKRSIINKGLVIAGGLTVLTGLFLMVHFESHYAKAVHQVGGAVMVILSITHMKTNWKPLTSSFAKRRAIWGVATLFAVSVVIMLITGNFAE